MDPDPAPLHTHDPAPGRLDRDAGDGGGGENDSGEGGGRQRNRGGGGGLGPPLDALEDSELERVRAGARQREAALSMRPFRDFGGRILGVEFGNCIVPVHLPLQCVRIQAGAAPHRSGCMAGFKRRCEREGLFVITPRK